MTRRVAPGAQDGRGSGPHPLVRLFEAIEPEDMASLLPHHTTMRALRLAMGHRPGNAAPIRHEERDPEFVEKIVGAARWLGRNWFRWDLRGIENVPAEGAALLVGNHSGGLMVFDTFFTWLAIWDGWGPERALYGLGHDFLQWDPMFRKYTGKFGAVPAGHENAERVLEQGHLVIVYPGSDLDVFRPWKERARVVLGGRRGFVRLALRTGVPLIPVVTAGGQEQVLSLYRGETLARAMGLDRRLRSKVFPVSISVPWGVTSGYFPYLPLPSRITTSFLPPVEWDDLGPADSEDEVTVLRCYRTVERLMQDEMDRLYADRPPLLGRLGRPRG